jgi:hypothetical protein
MSGFLEFCNRNSTFIAKCYDPVTYSYITENTGRTGKCGRLGNYMNFGFPLSVKYREVFDINQDQYYSDAEVIITNPPETSRTYSSICCGSSAGGSHGRSMLDSTSAWVSGNPLVTLNFVSVRTIKGRSS